MKLNETGYDEITPDDVKKSDDFAAKYGIKIYATDIESIIKGFVRENADDLEESVDKTVFEKEYKLLFGDLYMQTLHAANKLYCREGKTITAEQMLGAMHGLDKIMSEAASKAGYPEKIANGGIAPENFKKMQNYFAETFVPKDSSELALRTMQANADGFDFTSSKWKEGLGFTAFTEMVADEKDKLAAGPKNDEAKLKAARKYRAMTNYNGNRSWFSKFWSWRKNGREKRAIEQFKEIAKSTLKIGDREFEELAATQPNADLAALKEGIEKNCAKMETKKNLKGSMISSSAKDDISSSMREDESDRNSVLDSQPDDISLRERITVNEANHQNPRDEKKRKEEDKEKEVKAEKEKENDLNNRAPSA